MAIKPNSYMERFRRKRELLVLRDGKFVPKEGYDQGLMTPENLRSLPSELVTKEDADDSKAHALDPQHIVKSFVSEWEQKEKADLQGKASIDAISDLFRASLTPRPFTQYHIDIVRWRVQLNLINQAADAESRALPIDADAGGWLYFPKPDVRSYSWREGEMPRKWGRMEQHLAHKKLEVRVFGPIPPAIRDIFIAYNVPVPNIEPLVASLRNRMILNRELKAAMDKEIHDRLVASNPELR